MIARALYLRRFDALPAAVAFATAACASASLPELGPPSPRLEAEFVEATSVQSPLLVRFDWDLAERDARFSGQGVARLEGERARIDLFGPRGEAYLVAVLIGDELRLPPGVGDAPIPPPAMLWAAFGVFRPPHGVALSGSSEGERTRLRYGAPGDEWLFRFESVRLLGVEHLRTGAGRQLLELNGTLTPGRPRTSAYRDFGAFRELRLSFTEAEDVVEGFPPDIWNPAGF